MDFESSFEATRPRLTTVAFRLLGSIHDAEDAVQKTWIKAAAARHAEPENLDAWLTTILTRICLDDLRARTRRNEIVTADVVPSDRTDADEQYLRHENVSRALMVVLGQLTPPQRVAYVLHDLFGIPFQAVAQALGVSTDAAKKHASRARTRVRGATPPDRADARGRSVADAFLEAAAGGDLAAMVSLMAEDCVRVVDPALVPVGTRTEIRGGEQVAEETALFVDRIRTTARMMVDGHPTLVIAPGGHLLAFLDLTIRDGRVNRIEISRPAR